MEISSGVELVWSLAGREALLTKAREVEPDHFFCALLKYAEFSNADLGALKVPPLVLFALIAERDQIKAELQQKKMQTDLRRQIRAKLGVGNYQAKPEEVLHRAEESRQLFARAAERKREQNKTPGRIDVLDLLEVLLAHPTRVMVEVLGMPAIRAVVTPETRGDSVLNKYAREGVPSQTAVRKRSLPQVQVMAWAMQSLAKHPLMLICEPGLDVEPLVRAAVQKQHGPPELLAVDLNEISQDAKREELFRSQLAALLQEGEERAESLLYLDATRLPDADVSLGVIQANLQRKPLNLILAIGSQAYARAREKSSSVDSPYRIIWLHDLEHAMMPSGV